ncbi:MAG: hypothetical protein OZ921_12900 [Sorangiineae bacterium]|nr:hypothetical protein [Polyangiaceae bacterium]MEB2323406.1 hypothetical protein [Sorangiineae bacterium]
MSRRLAAAATLGLACSAVASARAEPPPAAPTGLRLEVSERGPGLPWRLSIVNAGGSPARLAADPRLLRLDVRVPGKKATETCALPAELRPSEPAASSWVTLAPGEGVSKSFDPRLYCFAAGGQWKLVPGALVTPHFGWPKRTRRVWRGGRAVEEPLPQKPPFVAATVVEGDAGGASSEPEQGERELDGAPFALRSTYAEWSSTRIAQDTAKKDTGPLELRVVRGSDADVERTATVEVRLKNRSKRAVVVYLRRDLLSFEVMGPDGLSTCDPDPDGRAPDRQAFTHLAPGGSLALTSRLVELCPRGTFSAPGLYLIHARLDATESGEDYGLDAFTGRVASARPGALRIRVGDEPLLRKRAMRVVMARTGSEPSAPR